MIPRENMCMNERTVVCEEHFFHNFIIRVDTATRAYGSTSTVPRKTS